MPLIYWSNSLPTIAEIWKNNPLVAITRHRAVHWDIRPLRIGLLNNMPDAALKATEGQFLRLIWSEPVLQIEPILMSSPWVQRSHNAYEYISQYYTPFSQIQKDGLDAMIISWANFWNGSIDHLPFWDELTDVIEWANKNTISTLTSCLATHAVMKHRHNVDRILNQKNSKDQKIWWTFEHKILDNSHPLVSGMNTRIIVPHSRWNDISQEQFETTWNQVLMSSNVAWVHLAVSHDFRWVMMQGHPEYDTVSLAREYLRDKKAWQSHEPANYITQELREFDPQTSLSNSEIEQNWNLVNNWWDSAKVMFSRWIALVYKLTNYSKVWKYMDGIDSSNPLESIKG